MTENQRYESIVTALTRDQQVTIDRARMFDGEAIKLGNKTFALIVNGKFVVKLPVQRVDALVASGDGERLDTGHGRVMKEWVAMVSGEEAQWLGLAEEAKTFVSSGMPEAPRAAKGSR